MVRNTEIKHYRFHSRKYTVQLVQLLLGEQQLLLRREKALPPFGYVWLFRNQPRTGFTCIRRIELEPTHEGFL